MKKIIPLLLFVFLTTISYSQNQNPNYDALLAKQMEADDYGMKMYVFVVLKTGSNTTTDKTFISDCFAGHMANISKLVASKQMVIAGPMKKNEDNIRGIFILNVATIEQAKELLFADPAVKANLLSADYYPWYGSAAIQEYLPFHDKVWKIKY